MTSPTNYTLLAATIQDLAEDDSTEFLSYIPVAVNMAEDRLFRLVDYDFSKESTSLSTTANVSTLTKPSDHRVTHNIYIVAGTNRIRLIKKTEDFLKDYWPSTTASASPKYYADKDVTTWMFAPTPNIAYNLVIEYEYKPTYLSSSNTTNVFSTYFPDLLFYASMSNAAEWMKDPVGKAEWEDKLNEALASVNNEGRRTRQDDNTVVNNPSGGRNVKPKNSV